MVLVASIPARTVVPGGLDEAALVMPVTPAGLLGEVTTSSDEHSDFPGMTYREYCPRQATEEALHAALGAWLTWQARSTTACYPDVDDLPAILPDRSQTLYAGEGKSPRRIVPSSTPAPSWSDGAGRLPFSIACGTSASPSPLRGPLP